MTAYPVDASERPDPDSIIVVDSATGRWLPGTPTPMLIQQRRGHAWQQTPGAWRLAEGQDPPETVYRAVRVAPGRAVCVGDGCTATAPAVAPGHVYACPFHVGRVLGDEPEVTDAPWTDGHSFFCGVGQPARDCPGASRGCDCRCHAGPSRDDLWDDEPATPLLTDEAARVPVSDGTIVPPQSVDKSTDPAQGNPIDPATTAGDHPGGKPEGDSTMATKKATARTAVVNGITSILAGDATAEQVMADPAIVAVVAPKKATTRHADASAAGKAKRAAVKADAPARAAKAKPAPAIRGIGTSTGKGAKATEPKAAPPAPAPVPGQNILTVGQYDSMVAAGETAALSGGAWVRPNGSLPSGTIKAPSADPATRKKYAPRWRYAVTLPEGTTVATVTESAPGAPALRGKAGVSTATARAAKAVVDAIDAMPGPDAARAYATDEAQAALTVIAKATFGGTVDADGDQPF